MKWKASVSFFDEHKRVTGNVTDGEEIARLTRIVQLLDHLAWEFRPSISILLSVTWGTIPDEKEE